MNPFDDSQRYDEVLEKVEKSDYHENEYDISFDGGWCTYITSPAIEPKVGDTITFWGHRFGIRRGFALNGVVVEYRTEEEQKAEWERQQQQRVKEHKEAYARSVDSYNERIAKLPAVFQDRIQHFRDFNPDWGWDFEAYELFCCEEATRLAEHFQTVDALNAFWDMDYDEQKDAFDASDEHSGNTWGTSLKLAQVYLSEPELIPQMHGALCPLIGCKGYGCHAARVTGEVEV